jgi:predicted N-acetyltransferase YhbS
MPEEFPPILLPAGFHLKSLADENDLVKVHRVLWRGFNHPGEPPADGLDDRVQMQQAPSFDKALQIVAVAPTGDFVAYCGTWYEAVNRIAYVEPVATDPDYRRMGLGKAAVLEGLRRCASLGATLAYVGSDELFYRAIGFRRIFTSQCWRK